MTEIRWRWAAFDELTPQELHGLLALRQRVFVVEQACAYLDCDGLDPGAWHVWAQGEGGAPLACTRLLAPGASYAEPAIGRVVTAPEVRRTGLGKELMRRSLRVCERLFGRVAVQVGAQLYLQRFYEELGFVRHGEVYDEDGIPHIHMTRPGEPGAQPPRLDRSRVELRPVSEEDVDHILSWVNDPSIVGNLAAFSGEPFTREQELAYVRRMQTSSSDRVFSVFAAGDGRYLGQVGLHQIHPRSKVGRLAVVIGSKAEMGKGFGSAAIASAIDRAFDAEGLHKVWLMVFDSNHRARAIYRRLGFRVEGRLREEYFHQGGWHTMVRMGLLASEWAGPSE